MSTYFDKLSKQFLVLRRSENGTYWTNDSKNELQLSSAQVFRERSQLSSAQLFLKVTQLSSAQLTFFPNWLTQKLIFLRTYRPLKFTGKEYFLYNFHIFL